MRCSTAHVLEHNFAEDYVALWCLTASEGLRRLAMVSSYFSRHIQVGWHLTLSPDGPWTTKGSRDLPRSSFCNCLIMTFFPRARAFHIRLALSWASAAAGGRRTFTGRLKGTVETIRTNGKKSVSPVSMMASS